MKVLKRVLKWITGAILVLLLLAFLVGFIAYWRSTNDCGKAGAPTNPMKAIVYCDYGVANLKLEEIEKPVPNDDQILVRVRAASVNPYDWHFVRRALDEVPVVWIDGSGANSDQNLIVTRSRLFDLLQLEIGHTIVAINNGLHRVGWCASLAAVVSRSPVGDEPHQECDQQQH